VKQVAAYFRNAKYIVSYTGAGISTSAGLPDYRGERGIWTLLEQGKSSQHVSWAKAGYTKGHSILTKLATENIDGVCDEPPLKFLVSTNVDGLHIKSGFPISKLAELHGNHSKVKCRGCSKYYLTDQLPNGKRVCVECGDGLKPTGVGFGCELPQDQYQAALYHSKQCDLALVLGTSMKVSPACNLPEWSYRNSGHLIICNYQKTPYDKYASVVIRCSTDEFLSLLFEELRSFSSSNIEPQNENENNNNENA
jgi:NAD+-dependent protein deacetylase sirtuin 6